MKIFSFIYVFSALFDSQNVFAGTCSDYPERRGLNYKEAKELLINRFLLDVINKITDEDVKNLIKTMIGIKE